MKSRVKSHAMSEVALTSFSGPTPRTLLDVLQRRSEHQQHQPIYTFLRGEKQESLTYEELDGLARSLAAHLGEICGRGERALLLYPPGLEYIVALYACMYAGLIAVPAYVPRPNRPLSRLESIVGDAQPAVALTTRELLNSPRSGFLRTAGPMEQLRWLATDDLPPAELAESRSIRVSSDAPAMLQYTSGSTASPKGVILSHANLLHNSEMIRQNFRMTGESVGVIWLPPYHDMGLIGGILQPLYAGFPVYLLSPNSFLQRPALWLQAVSHFHGTVSGGPNFAYDLCLRRISEEEADELDLSSWSVAFTGAEPIRKQTLDEFCKKFARCGFRRSSFHPCYGMAETTLIATGACTGEEPRVKTVSSSALEQNRVEPPAEEDDASVVVSCGQPVGRQDLQIADPATREVCPANRIGEIWISGPSVAGGYWGKPDQTKETFGASVNGRPGSYLRTGDLGFLCQGELYVTGRIKDLIIIRGQNHYPHDIEFTVQRSHPALQLLGSAAFSVEHDGVEGLVIVQEWNDRAEGVELQEVIATISRAVNENHDLQIGEVVPVRPWTIPRTTSGKIQRYLCRAAYIAGTLERVSPTVPGHN
jgi:acyl-CoA synthetase (AMP-forming)/AMP-acid ligase II